MRAYQTTGISINGEIHGAIWQPGVDCRKDISASFTRHIGRPFSTTIEKLRDAYASITNDGDFRECSIANAFLTVTRLSPVSNTIRRRTVELSGAWDGNADYFEQNCQHDFDSEDES